MYRAIVFDVDGTLLNPAEGILSSVKYTIAQGELEQLSDDKLREFVGPPVQNSFQKFYGVDKIEAQRLAEIFRNRYKNDDLFKAEVYEGVPELLAELKQHYKLGVATYKREDYAITLLKHLDLAKYFDIICGGDNENKLTKSDIILKCTDLLGTKKCLMVGDSIHDLNGAQVAGIDFLGVTYGFGFTPGSCDDKQKCLWVDSVPQIFEVLRNNFKGGE